MKPKSVAEIAGKPEGRQGCWIIDTETAIDLVGRAKGKYVHCFIGEGFPMLIGADWTKPQVVKFLQETPKLRLALLFEPNLTMKHQLVACTDHKRHAFDVGQIVESAMMAVPHA